MFACLIASTQGAEEAEKKLQKRRRKRHAKDTRDRRGKEKPKSLEEQVKEVKALRKDGQLRNVIMSEKRDKKVRLCVVHLTTYRSTTTLLLSCAARTTLQARTTALSFHIPRGVRAVEANAHGRRVEHTEDDSLSDYT